LVILLASPESYPARHCENGTLKLWHPQSPTARRAADTQPETFDQTELAGKTFECTYRTDHLRWLTSTKICLDS
jgi:hypothetical protein